MTKIRVTGKGQLKLHVLSGTRVRLVGKLTHAGTTFRIGVNVAKTEDGWKVIEYGRFIRKVSAGGTLAAAGLGPTRSINRAIVQAVENYEAQSGSVFVAAERAQLERLAQQALDAVAEAQVQLEESIVAKQLAMQELARFDRAHSEAVAA